MATNICPTCGEDYSPFRYCPNDHRGMEDKGISTEPPTPPLAEAIKAVLVNEGADSEGGWHSWRCFDKGRYPEPCTCTDDVVEQIITAIRGKIGESDE